ILSLQRLFLLRLLSPSQAYPLPLHAALPISVGLLAGSFGGINLEDISAPRCFEIEKRLKECCDIPVFHDDQHGTAVITLAGLINALKLVGKKIEDVKIVTSGAGAAGIAIIRLLMAMGLKNVI